MSAAGTRGGGPGPSSGGRRRPAAVFRVRRNELAVYRGRYMAPAWAYSLMRLCTVRWCTSPLQPYFVHSSGRYALSDGGRTRSLLNSLLVRRPDSMRPAETQHINSRRTALRGSIILRRCRTSTVEIRGGTFLCVVRLCRTAALSPHADALGAGVCQQMKCKIIGFSPNLTIICPRGFQCGASPRRCTSLVSMMLATCLVVCGASDSKCR